jgi:hypothetical protein
VPLVFRRLNSTYFKYKIEVSRFTAAIVTKDANPEEEIYEVSRERHGTQDLVPCMIKVLPSRP